VSRAAAAGAASAWCVYVLRCAGGTLYTGSTTDVRRRLAQHRSGRGGAFTRSRRPVCLVHVEPHADRASAQRREAELKGWSRAQKLAFLRYTHRAHE
jgi:putative endonuclease